MQKKRVFILLLILVSTVFLRAKNIYIRGYVVDEQGHGIEAVNIFCKETSQGNTTNTQGYYELALSDKDSVYNITFSSIGYESRIYTLKRTKEAAYQLNIVLKTTSKRLSDVEITGSKHQTGSMQTINVKQMSLVPDASGGNIESIIMTQPGVHSTNELSTQYSVRGGNYDENSVYVNNIEVYRPLLIREGQQEGLSFINPDMVSSVRFSAGGFDAQYGDKMASVLDVSYKRPKAFEASASAGLLGATAYVGTSGKKFTQIHGIRYKTSKYLLGSLDTKGEYNPSFFDYQTYQTFRVTPKWDITFLGYISDNNYKFIPQTRSTSFGTLSMAKNFTVYFDGLENDRFLTYFGAFTLNFKPQKNLTLGLIASAFNTNESVNYEIEGDYWLSDLDLSSGTSNKENATTSGVGTYHQHARDRLNATVVNLAHRGEWKINRNNHLIWGANIQREIINDHIREWESRDSAGYSLPYNGQNVRVIYNLYSSENLFSTRLSAFVQNTYRRELDNFTWVLTGGVRAAYWSFNNEPIVSPRASMTLFPHWKTDIDFRFSTGVYYQSPFYKEIRHEYSDAAGNREMELNHKIKSQRSLHFVLGTDYYFRSWERPFKFTIEAYYKPADRVISYYVDNLSIYYSGKNDAKAYTTGLDCKLFGEFVPGTDSWISLSLMRSRENIIGDSYEVYSNTGRFIGTVYPGYISRPNEQRYNVSMFFQDYFPNFPKYKVNFKLIWADGLPFGPPHSERYQAVLRMPGYKRVDMGFSRNFIQGREKFMNKLKPVKTIGLHLDFFNLFDIKNVNSYYWITDIYNDEYAIPNYLTGFRLNLRVNATF